MTHEKNVTLRSECKMLNVIEESIFLQFSIRNVENMQIFGLGMQTTVYGWNSSVSKAFCC